MQGLRDSSPGARKRLPEHRIEALAARAARLDGAARSAVDARLRDLVDAELRARADAAAQSTPASERPVAGAIALSTLLGQFPRARGAGAAASAGSGPGTRPDPGRDASSPRDPDSLPHAGAFPPLPALDAFRHTWSRLRIDSQLQHALADVPEDAGPMNSTVLVHRALALMHDTAPDYLRHFLGYVDALAGVAWISPERATTPAPRSPRPAQSPSPANASGPGKGPRPRSRGRRRSG